MKLRPDFLTQDSPQGIEVVQLTEEPVHSCHIYMEAQIFTADSRRLVVHRSAHPHGSDKDDPEHRYLLCDLDNGCELSPLTDETGATAPSVFGETLYYLVNETKLGGGRLTLKKVKLDGTGRETLLVTDGAIPGGDLIPASIYPLSTIRSDGKKLAAAGFMGTEFGKGHPFGLMVFDLVDPSVEVVLSGPSWCNLHPQYCRSKDPERMRDIMVQENHGNEIDSDGKTVKLTGGDGADIHLVRDDGEEFRSFPWGRDGNEFCQGHQCWRGRSSFAITSTSTRDPEEAQLIEAEAVAFADHVGLATPGGLRNDLSRDFDNPHFYHFSTDIAGERFITDSGSYSGEGLFAARMGEAGKDALSDWTYLVNQRTSKTKETHSHPFLSPDGTMGFFNSDESGLRQAYMIRGLDSIF